MDERLRRHSRENFGGEKDIEILVNRLRAGEVTKEGLRIAAVLGDKTANMALESIGEPTESIENEELFLKRLEELKDRDIIVRLAKELCVNFLQAHTKASEYLEHEQTITSVLQLVDQWLATEGHKERQKVATSLQLQWPYRPQSNTVGRDGIRSSVLELMAVLNPAKRSRYGIGSLEQLLSIAVPRIIDEEAEESHRDIEGRLQALNQARGPVIDWALNREEESS